jgi:hypothetical protein
MTSPTLDRPSGRALSNTNLYAAVDPGIAAVQDAPTIGYGTLREEERRHIRVQVEGPVPAWVSQTVEYMSKLFALPDNWDADGARRIAPSAAMSALRLVLAAAATGAPPPSLVPTVEGGLQVEWHTHGIDLEIETLGSDRFAVLYEDQQTGADWEAEAGLGSPAVTLPLTELARRTVA